MHRECLLLSLYHTHPSPYITQTPQNHHKPHANTLTHTYRYVDGVHIKASPFTIPVLDGRPSETYSIASGAGLLVGATAKPSYFQVRVCVCTFLQT